MITSISQWETQTNYNDGQLATAATLLAPPKLVKSELNELKAMVDVMYGNPVELWNSTDTYTQGRLVRYNDGTSDKLYSATSLAGNTNKQPDISGTYWTISNLGKINLFRSDEYLSGLDIAKMYYDVTESLIKIQYTTATDTDYQTFSYTNGDLTSIDHYIGGVLKGTTTLTYDVSGNLSSVNFA